MKTYAIGGVVPILSPVSGFPRMQKLLARFCVDTWNTSSRLISLAQKTPRTRLHIMHAQNDLNVGWKHSDLLFDSAGTGLARTAHLKEEHRGFSRIKTLPRKDGNAGDGDSSVKRTITQYGGKPIRGGASRQSRTFRIDQP